MHPVTAVRSNTLTTTREALLRELSSYAPITLPWSPDAVLVNATVQELTQTKSYQRGDFYIQNLASQLPALVLAPKPYERILDLCAAPGGKTTHLAALMENTGELVANDASKVRSFKLRALLERYGVTNATCSVRKGEFLWRTYPDYFDGVLVDAPCSMTLTRSGRELKALARQQTYLLRSALACVRPGGRVVYATCTNTKEENEAVLAWIVEHLEGVTVVPITEFLPEFQTREGYLRIPKTDIFEPFFVARLRKDA